MGEVLMRAKDQKAMLKAMKAAAAGVDNDCD